MQRRAVAVDATARLLSRASATGKIPNMEHDQSDREFNTATARLLRREALRRAAEELNTTSGPGLESMLSRISDEVTADALEKRAETGDEINPEPAPSAHRSHPSTP